MPITRPLDKLPNQTRERGLGPNGSPATAVDRGTWRGRAAVYSNVEIAVDELTQ